MTSDTSRNIPADKKAEKPPPAARSRELLDAVAAAAAAGGAAAGFEALAARLESERRYPELFEVLVMASRTELGLPLLQIGPATDIPDELVEPHEEAIAAACRRVGALFLSDGDIARAWPYLRAVGDTRPVADAIERVEAGTRRKDIESLIEIALHEGAHPRKGLELVVHQYGICSSITNFEQFHPTLRRRDQEACARVLVDALYGELVESIRAEAQRRTGSPAPETTLGELLERRPELVEGDAYYIDASHLWSVVRFASFLERIEDLDRAIELAAYGKGLSPMYKYESEPPFEKYYEDHDIYLRGMRAWRRGDAAAARQAGEHFTARARKAIEDGIAGYPTRAVLNVLSRMGCFDAAIDLALAFDAVEGMGPCTQPSVYDLCQMAGDFGRLEEIARERGDALPFIAGLVQRARSTASSGDAGA